MELFALESQFFFHHDGLVLASFVPERTEKAVGSDYFVVAPIFLLCYLSLSFFCEIKL